MVWAIRWGADTVMDLSTGRNIQPPHREWICATRRSRSAPCRSIRRWRSGDGRSGQTDLGALHGGHADRAVRTRRRLLQPSTPASVCLYIHLCTANRVTGASLRAAARSWQSGAWRITWRKASSTPTSRKSPRPDAQIRRVAFSLATAFVPARSRTPPTLRNSPNWRHFGELTIAWKKGCQVMDRRPRPCCQLHKIKINMDKQLKECGEVGRSTPWAR